MDRKKAEIRVAISRILNAMDYEKLKIVYQFVLHLK